MASPSTISDTDVRQVNVQEVDGKIVVAPANDSLVRLDELVQSIKALKDRRVALRAAAQNVNDSWDTATAAEKADLLKAASVSLYGSVNGLTNIVAWLVRQEVARLKGPK